MDYLPSPSLAKNMNKLALNDIVPHCLIWKQYIEVHTWRCSHLSLRVPFDSIVQIHRVVRV